MKACLKRVLEVEYVLCARAHITMIVNKYATVHSHTTAIHAAI